MIIDAHTHVFPPEVRRQREVYVQRDLSFKLLYADPKAKMATFEELIAEMDKSGVARAIVCGFPWKDNDLCRQHNDYIIEAIKQYPERLVGLAIVNPVSGNACHLELSRCFANGLKGVGEISATAQGYSLDDKLVSGRIAGAVKEAGFFMLIHSNENVGHSYAGKTSDSPPMIYRFLKNFSAVKIILAHWGGGFFFYELMPEVAKLTSSVYYDTAASPLLYRPEIYKIAVNILGAKRILFGTDYPLIEMQRQINELKDTDLDLATTKLLFGRNTEELIL